MNTTKKRKTTKKALDEFSPERTLGWLQLTVAGLPLSLSVLQTPQAYNALLNILLERIHAMEEAGIESKFF